MFEIGHQKKERKMKYFLLEGSLFASSDDSEETLSRSPNSAQNRLLQLFLEDVCSVSVSVSGTFAEFVSRKSSLI